MRLFAAVLALVAATLVRAAGVSVTNDLIFHFDAAAQPSARNDAGLPPLSSMQAVDFLLNSARSGRMAVQPVPERRPAFVARGNSAYLKFDGIDDFLFIETQRSSTEELTLFVLAAPAENRGHFAAIFGTAALGQNDYTSGINMDLGPQPTPDISVVNIESAGATGFRDLLTPGFFNAAARPFGSFHVFTVRSRPGKAGTEFFLDGFKGGDREREASRIALDAGVIGGRLYSNDPNRAPFAQGLFNGAIAEVLAYRRALSDAERSAVEEALLARTVELNALLQGKRGHALEVVKDPPIVQMLVPGFTVHELPLRIGNLNNVRYRHDGKLVGLGYDGRIYLLSDTDGDGLEDKAEFFWEQRTLRGPLGMALTPKDDPRGDGIFVASKGKVSLILDKDRDGRAEEEKVIATGWPEIIQNVDTLGLAVDPRDGSIYFGLGCANFADAYLMDKATGRSQYDINSIRGTIQRLSADFSRRETICTGVRFTCALAFNRHGDLFATDQEGATWLPNGNPFDELLHIERGKHYGFPPRHPKHLPDVRDEPPVFDYGPQHQSTVGMVFNESVNGGPHFGPAHWEGDALICGESRGKLYRTRLARTPLGYVAQNELIAALGMLTVDACVSPSGDLAAACHSGPPDWGTGPAGEGRIFKIRYAARNLPQPVTAWAAAADEFRIAFDRPLGPEDWAHAAGRVKIEAGEFVSAGDRFEVLRPGYQVVRDQMASPRRWVEVLGLNLSEDRRTLVLRVPRQTEPVTYAVTLPLPDRWKQNAGIPQHPQIDVALTLNGVSATVTVDGREQSIVLPHPSLAASAELTRGSVEHERFLRHAATAAATLSLRTVVDVSNPFVPTVQPGSKLDWDPATDPVASRGFSVESDHGVEPEVVADSSGAANRRAVALARVSKPGADRNGLFLAHGDLRHRLSPARLLLPWARATSIEAPALAENKTRTDVKGNWLRGRRVFYGDGGCATCHTVRGEGMAFGPDLSNLVHRDRASVLHDIIHPSATINPDHTGSLVKLDDGLEHAGLVGTLDATKLILRLPAGAQLEVPRVRVRSIEPLRTSLMPAGLDQQLSTEQMEDLLTFLLVEGLEPASATRTDLVPPPARRMSELERVLGGKPQAPNNPPALRILLAAGPKDHGPDEHDYPLWLERWSRLLSLAENVTVHTSSGFPAPSQLEQCDVAVFYNANPGWNSEKAAVLDQFHRRGGGAVYLHYAVNGGEDPAAAAERIGLAFALGSGFRHGEIELTFPQPNHPITHGLPTLRLLDETYWNMRGDPSRVTILGTAVEAGASRPQLWTLQREKARIAGCIPGHYTWTFDDPLFRVLVFRSICWAGRQDDIDRLAELSVIGARIQE